MSMKALTFAGKQQIVLTELPKPQIVDATDAVVKVTLCGICGRLVLHQVNHQVNHGMPDC
jgi:threonine dehydrogenase-like Zn-dependent dehydrogenase